jgi:hypothetical protein
MLNGDGMIFPVDPDLLWPLHERLAQLAYQLELNPELSEITQEVWEITVAMSAVLRGIVTDNEDSEDEDDDSGLFFEDEYPDLGVDDEDE